MKELRAVLDEYPGDRVLVGEDDDIAYLGNGADELHLVFNFPLMRTEQHHAGAHPAEPGGAPGSTRRAAGARLGLQHVGQPRHIAHLHPVRRLDAEHAAELARLNAALVLTLTRHAVPLQRRRDRHDRSDHHRSRQTARHDGDLVLRPLVKDLKIDPVEAAARAGRDEPRQKPHPHAVVRPTQCRLLPGRT